MRSVMYGMLAAMFVSTGITRMSLAGTLLGERYVAFSCGVVDYDEQETNWNLEDGLLGSIVYNYPVDGGGKDIQLGVDYLSAEGPEQTETDYSHIGVYLDLILPLDLLDDGQWFHPYVHIGLHFLDQDVSGPANAEDDSDFGLRVGAGLELDMIPHTLTRISVVHDNTGDDATNLTAQAGYWITDDILPMISLSRETGSESTSIQGGIAFTFF